ncbi:MAG: hypothetical protein Q4B22_08310 [Eubacteriales bacterium]|nr:hypothetical protein [Eubacteriales bacterium]
MNAFRTAACSIEGRTHLIVMVVGILIGCFAGLLLWEFTTFADIIIFIGCIVSAAGAQQFCQWIVRCRDES